MKGLQEEECSQQKEFQEEMFSLVCDTVDNYIGEIGGYYHVSISNLKDDIYKAIQKNI